MRPHENDVLERGQFVLRNALDQRGRSDQRDRLGVRHPIADRVLHEGLEKRARNRTDLQDAENRDVKFRTSAEKNEDAVALAYSQAAKNVCKTIRLNRQVFESVALGALFVRIDQRQLVPPP